MIDETIIYLHDNIAGKLVKATLTDRLTIVAGEQNVSKAGDILIN